MKLSELCTTHYLNCELSDRYGHKDSDIISYPGYTLGDFFKDNEEYKEFYEWELDDISMDTVNDDLVKNGFAPVSYNLERDRMQYACMLAYYAAKNGADDSIAIFDKCVQIAQTIDFKVIQYEGRWMIDAEWARGYAKELCKLAEYLANKEF